MQCLIGVMHKMKALKSILVLIILFSSIIYSYDQNLNQMNESKFGLNCSEKHPARNIEHTILLMIDREKNIIKESTYCGSFTKVNLKEDLTKNSKFSWHSRSPFSINGEGKKQLDLSTLQFKYSGSWEWYAQCNLIDWDEAIELEKQLRC